MRIKKIIISISIFIIAISGAFASHLLLPEDGYLKLEDHFPGQLEECGLTISCSNTGTFPCVIKLTSSPTEYNVYRLVGLECADQLTNDTRRIIMQY